jgi:hypothetical protein
MDVTLAPVFIYVCVCVCRQAPMFYHVDAKFDVERGVGRLSCTATGEPAPVLYWIQPSGRATKYSPSASAAAAPKGFVIHPSSAPASPAAAAATSTTDRDAVDDDRPGVFEAVLELDASTDYFTRPSSQKQAGGWVSGPHPPQSGMYICVADNEAGNATVTVSLPSPVRPPAISTSGKQNAADSTSAGDESEEFSSLVRST